MLALRKLLLADDSITIQKVVALTFADEGIEVLAVSNGADAIDKLEEFWPDVVLADVYMPKMTGLQVCDYIKRNEKLKHIPVMLLVGSFEPFDEAEARRVGADDTLTKPFQSIRTLVEKVGVLLGRDSATENLTEVSLVGAPEPLEAVHGAAEADGPQTLDGAETLEFPDPVAPDEIMNTDESKLTTANTQPLSPQIGVHLQQPSNEDRAIETAMEVQKMETHLTSDAGLELSEGFGDSLLDLSHFEAAPRTSSDDDVILEIDFDSPAPEMFYAAPADNWQSVVAVEAPAEPAVTEDDAAWTGGEEVVEWDGEIQTSEVEWAAPTPVHEATVVPEAAASELSVAAATQAQEDREPSLSGDYEVVPAPTPTSAVSASPVRVTGQITLEQLSPEAIDAIARRVVELSERVVQEIAWEVVPQLAELLIKQKLEESR